MCYVRDIVNYTHNFHHHTPRDPPVETSPTPRIIIRSYLEQSTRTHRHTKVKPQWAELVLSGEPLENPWCRMVFVLLVWDGSGICRFSDIIWATFAHFFDRHEELFGVFGCVGFGFWN